MYETEYTNETEFTPDTLTPTGHDTEQPKPRFSSAKALEEVAEIAQRLEELEAERARLSARRASLAKALTRHDVTLVKIAEAARVSTAAIGMSTGKYKRSYGRTARRPARSRVQAAVA